MAKALNDHGALKVYICFGSDLNEAAIRQWAETDLGIKITFPLHVCPPPTSSSKLSRARAFLRLAKQAKQFVDGHTTVYVRDYILYLAALPIHKRIIFELHQWSYYKTNILDHIVRTILTSAFRGSRTTRIITISEVLRRRWIAVGTPEEKILSLHDGIDAEFFAQRVSRSTSRSQLNLPDSPLVLYAGSLYENRTIDWFVSLAKDVPDLLVLVIGGDKHEAENWSEKTAEIANLNFMPRKTRPDLLEYLYGADVLVFSMSRSTRTFDICSPLKIFEYMAAGKVVVAPDLDNLREVLQPEFAELYEIDRYSSFLSAIKAAVARQRTSDWKAGEAGRTAALAEYSWNHRANLALGTPHDAK